MKPCPRCKSHSWFMDRMFDRENKQATFQVVCKVCGLEAEKASSEELAIEAWNDLENANSKETL